ncbi:exonuclease 1 isoform X1 [Asparagus officinalis]|uniref:exonuclease 1 isoform X1 n=1 Tax=Asparagus officinalis TaxID=4686 RepID=UPI00098E69C6|nr:exonuclease 1 isoform X1 [Asparagus officinalis]
MGIQNLLRFLKPFIFPVHIKKYSGKRVGVDAYSWLHKGAYSCSMELCLNSKTEASKRYLKYFMHRINLLKHYNITPVVVFDGGNIPCKSDTKNVRHRGRETNLELAKEKLKEGDVRAAIEFFQRAVHITPTMAHELIQILRSESIEFIVAPYEADAQLAYLSSLSADQGGIEAVITEDSDLIAYGCQKVIFKMDKYGNAEEFLMDKVLNSVGDGLSFKHFDKELFTGMCVLAGCDFLPSISGIGTKRAHSLVSKYRNLDRVLSVLNLDKRYQVPEDYSESFGRAIAVFHHARIYDAETKSLKPLKPLDQKHVKCLNGDLDLLGPDLPPSIAAAIAEGHLNPITMEAFNHYPKLETCYSVEKVPGFDQGKSDESQTTCTQESCVTIFSAHQSSNENSSITEQIVMDKEKYKKEALALGKLAAPMKTQEVAKLEVHKNEVPNNNPFKRRKLDNATPEEKDICKDIVGQSPDVLCSSSPESQVTIELKSPVEASIRKHGKLKKPISRKGHKGVSSEKKGILKFFERL